MGEYAGEPPARANGNEAGPSSNLMTISLGIASCILFALGLIITESVGEFALDMDLKPFFLPYILIAVTRFGLPTMSIGLGAALGEGVLDVFEGYELDDPIGFLGYVLGFTAFGWYLHEVAEDPGSTRALSIGAILGAFIVAIIEAFAFFVFESSADLITSAISAGGNTVAHGIIFGAIPLVLVYRMFGKQMRDKLV